MPDAPPMQRFWLSATLNKANGVLNAVWGYEKDGGPESMLGQIVWNMH